MSSKKSNPKKKNAAVDAYPLEIMHDWIARLFMWILVAFFPLMMGVKKYTAITVYKKDTFYTITIIAIILLVLAYILYLATRETAKKRLTRAELLSAPCMAEFALLAYWFFMVISTLLAIDPGTAFSGLPDRDNGLIIQTLYIAVFFILSRRLATRSLDVYVFVWGGIVLAAVTMLHYFGADLYGVGMYIAGSGDKITFAYDGPYFGEHFANQLAVTKKAANFMGPVGNINLGSYILTVCCVVSAGVFINRIRNEWDKYNSLPIVAFALILWAEINMNTSAGIVALGVAAAALLPVLCVSFAHLRRIFTVYGTACFVLLFDHLLVSVLLCDEAFGTTGRLYLAGTFFFALAALIVWLALEGEGRTWFAKNIKKEFGAKKSTVSLKTSTFRAASFALLGAVVIGVIGYSLYVSAPKDTAAKAVSSAASGNAAAKGSTKVTFSNEDIFNEIGQILRGNFDDKLGHSRLFTWKLCFSLVQHRPLLGNGPDNFKTITYLQGDYYTKQINEFFGDRALDKAHNEFIDILMSNGIIGLVCFAAFLCALLYYAFRRSGKGTGAAAPLGVAVLAYAVHAFFGYQLPLQSGVMWALMGLCAAYIRFEQKEEAQLKYTEETPVADKILSNNKAFWAMVIFAAGIAAGCIQLIIFSFNGGIAPLASRIAKYEPYSITAQSLKDYLTTNLGGILALLAMIIGAVIFIREIYRKDPMQDE